MKKMSAVVFKNDGDRLIAALQKLRCVEVSRIPCPETDGGVLQRPGQTEAAAAELSRDAAETKKAIEFLMKYDRRKYSLFCEPVQVRIDDFDAGLDSVVMAEVARANGISDKMSELQSRIAEASAAVEAYTPWVGMEIQLPESRTAHTVSLCGTLPQTADISALEGKLSSLACVLSFDAPEDGRGAKAIPLCMSAYKDDYEQARRLLFAAGFSVCAVSASEEDGWAEGRRRYLATELEQLEGELEKLRVKATECADKLPDMKAMYDIIATRQDRLRAKEMSLTTEKTAMLTGWVPAKSVDKVTKVLDGAGAAYSFSEPEDGDDVPVLLDNNRFARNFEPVLAMYSLPAYGRFDPTAIMSLFYVVIFGLMFADVGYGLILFAGCLAGLKLLHPGENLKRMMIMFAACSVACVAGGILFGGIFGDLPVAVRENFMGQENVPSTAVWFDMIENPMAFLALSLGVGAAHIVCAMVIKFVILTKDGHLADAIMDVGSWLLVFAGIGVYFLNSTVGLIMALAGVAMLVLTQGRHEKNVFMKLAKGVMSLYDIVSYASDLLSYSRILALGLASAVIASVVNLLGTMGGVNFGGILLFIVVFLIGHVINFLVNILGTYVHTSRLQYIEFFGKFFESGGREFTPLEPKNKYVDLR